MASRLHAGRNAAKYVPGNAWMLTFADLLSLLLTFFVLVFSMNTIRFEDWKAVVRTMSDEFNPNRPQISATEHKDPPSVLQAKPKGLSLSYLEAVISQRFGQIPLFENGDVWRMEGKVIVSIPASLLFDRKEAIPKQEGVRALRDLAGVLIQLRNKIQIAGHTDQSPVANQLFRSNWELSLTRARIIAGILSDAGYREPMAVLGFADTRFNQLPGSLTQQRRYDLAERIDIIIVDERRDRGLYDLF